MFVKEIAFLDKRNVVVRSCKITSLPINEQIIISKSIKFYNDPEPCFIHRSALIKIIIIEMDEYFYSMSKEGIDEIKFSVFREKFMDTLEIGKEVESIRFII
ncbi:MAG TPA: hypothetical protein VIK72_09545 [Clostridiaceae bacterium]